MSILKIRFLQIESIKKVKSSNADGNEITAVK